MKIIDIGLGRARLINKVCWSMLSKHETAPSNNSALIVDMNDDD
jgi:hypothetical protein